MTRRTPLYIVALLAVASVGARPATRPAAAPPRPATRPTTQELLNQLPELERLRIENKTLRAKVEVLTASLAQEEAAVDKLVAAYEAKVKLLEQQLARAQARNR